MRLEELSDTESKGVSLLSAYYTIDLQGIPDSRLS